MEASFLAFSVIILLFSVIVHEVMHGLVALHFGDSTAQRAGRLTLNPIPHIDLVGTILVPALLLLANSPFMFGWAKPVPVNPLNFKDVKKGELFVSAAGIFSNLGLAILAGILYRLLITFDVQPILLSLLSFTVSINLILAIFNLIPIPPLDGSKVLMALLPYRYAQEFARLERYGFVMLLALVMIPIGGTSLLNLILIPTTSFLKSLLLGY